MTDVVNELVRLVTTSSPPVAIVVSLGSIVASALTVKVRSGRADGSLKLCFFLTGLYRLADPFVFLQDLYPILQES